jgi:hypothetical protein
MARTTKKGGGVNKGGFKLKKMNKGWSSIRKVPVGSRPVLRITEPVDKKAEKSKSEG